MRLCKFIGLVGSTILAVRSAAAEGVAAYDADTSTLTLDGLVTNVTAEADLGSATNVVLTHGGGVDFASNATLAKTYSIGGSGLDSTGVVSVASGKSVWAPPARLGLNTFGRTLVKRGAGTLAFTDKIGPIDVPTRWIVEAGRFEQWGADMYGGHHTTTTNGIIDVREGAVFVNFWNNHNPIGTLELTGGRFESMGGRNPGVEAWGNTAFKGGVTAHAAATPSSICLGAWAHLGHYEVTNCTFAVEEGATLLVEGVLTNGFYQLSSPIANKLIKTGAGELVLTRDGGWTGGTRIEGGTITVASAHALGTNPVELAGDVTLNVLAGTSFVCPRLTGSGTLTKTGAGAATFDTVVEGVTVMRADGEGTQPNAVSDGVLQSNGSLVALDVPAGQVLTLTEIVDASGAYGLAAYTDLVKTGAGTLVLPDTNNLSLFRKLRIAGGTVQIAAENNLGNGALTLTGGGTLAFSKGLTVSSHFITVSGAGGFNVASNMSVIVGTNCIRMASATFTKSGKGTLSLSGSNWQISGAVNSSTCVVADEGEIWFAGDTIGEHASLPTVTLEAHEGAYLVASGHVPVGPVVLRGGTLCFNYNTQMVVSDTGNIGFEEICGRWTGFALNGTVTVLPSKDGTPSVIRGARNYLAHAETERGRRTVFDVREGAVLRLQGRLSEGRSVSSVDPDANGLTKIGAGELVLAGALDCTRPVCIQEGTLTVVKGGSIPDATPLVVSPRARLRLGDGVTLASSLDATSAFLSTADVWMDATRLGGRNGQSFTRVPNFGAAGGAFAQAKTGTVPTAPVFTTNAIHGLPALYFNGGSALVLDSYTNKTANMSVFMVAKWTSWSYNGAVGGLGQWGGGLSMISTAATDNDNATPHSFHTETYTTIDTTSVSAPSVASLQLHQTARTVGVPYFDQIRYANGTLTAREYVGDETADATATATQAAGSTFDINRVGLGGRLRTGGAVQYYGSVNHASNRMYIGDIGELLVFTRVLTTEEEQTVASYLKRKWFGSTAAAPATNFVNAASGNVEIDVAEGTGGYGGAVASAGANGLDATLRKTGSGRLAFRTALSGTGVLEVAEGSLELSAHPLASRVDVWLDATDDAALTTNAAGKVTSVVNKGRAGGVFGLATGRWGGSVPYPGLTAAGINGRPSLVFDTNAGLALHSYTNRADRRTLHIYAVMKGSSQRGVEGKGKWGGPFSLYDSRQSGDDQTTTGSWQITETLNSSGVNQMALYAGQCCRAGNVLPAGGLDEPHLFICHQESRGCLFGYEWASTDSTQIPAYAFWINDQGKSVGIDTVNVGGRSTTGGRLQWSDTNATANRTWSGLFGELIVTTEKLTTTEETQLLAYLRKKWLDKGTGSATPPAFLSGDYGTADFGGLGLRLLDGTTVEQAGPTCALASFETGTDVTFVRDWTAGDAGFALFDIAGLFTLGDSPTLDVVTAPSSGTKLLGGVLEGTLPKTWTFRGDQAQSSYVTQRADGVYLGLGLGTVIFLR